MKNSADLGECYPSRPSASVDNTLLDLQNSSYPTQLHSVIAKYIFYAKSRLNSFFSFHKVTGKHLISGFKSFLELICLAH